MYADGDSLQYIDKTAAESYLNVRTYPSALTKKVGRKKTTPLHIPFGLGLKTNNLYK